MAEMHQSFASGEPMSAAEKQKDATHILDKLHRLKGQVGDADIQKIDDKIRGQLLPEYKKSPVPATAYHGDANCGNFIVDKDMNVTTIDVGSMKHSLDSSKGVKSGASDVGRFLESLQASHAGKLSGEEVGRLQSAFDEEYFSKLKLSKADFDAGIKMYRAELEIAALRFAASPQETQAALVRLGSLLGLSLGAK
jgi:hypothetical protein